MEFLEFFTCQSFLYILILHPLVLIFVITLDLPRLVISPSGFDDFLIFMHPKFSICLSLFDSAIFVKYLCPFVIVLFLRLVDDLFFFKECSNLIGCFDCGGSMPSVRINSRSKFVPRGIFGCELRTVD